MRLNLLFGFLGSGKTTLAARLLKEWGSKAKLALIVNEFGDVGVDGEILSGSSIDMIELSSGCLCCTLKGSLLNAVEELARKGADHIVIEATGVASPEELLENFSGETLMQSAEIGPIVTVIDAAKYLKIKDMLGEFYLSQIEYADILILNKLDLATAELVDQVRSEVREQNPDALVRIAEQCDIDLDEIMRGPASRVALEFLGAVSRDEQFAQHSCGDHGHDHHGHDHGHDHRHAPAESFVVDIAAPMRETEFRKFMQAMPGGLWRAKGFVSLDGSDRLVQFAMGDLQITPSEPRRRRYMVFIGKDLDERAIHDQLTELTMQESAK